MVNIALRRTSVLNGTLLVGSVTLGFLTIYDMLFLTLNPLSVWLSCIVTVAISYIAANRASEVKTWSAIPYIVSGTFCVFDLWRRFLLSSNTGSTSSVLMLVTAIVGVSVIVVSWIILVSETKSKAAALTFLICAGALSLMALVKFNTPSTQIRNETPAPSHPYVLNPEDTSRYEYKLTLWEKDREIVLCFNASGISHGVSARNSNSYILYFGDRDGCVQLLDGACAVEEHGVLLYHSSNYLLEKLEAE